VLWLLWLAWSAWSCFEAIDVFEGAERNGFGSRESAVQGKDEEVKLEMVMPKTL